MKRAIIAAVLSIAGLGAAQAGMPPRDVKFDSVRVERNGNYMALGVIFGLQDLEVSTDQCVLLTPQLANGEEQLTLPAVAIYGRHRYYHYLREEGDAMLSGRDETTIRAKQMPAEVAWEQVVPYQPWMDGATFSVERCDYGCGRTLLAQERFPVGGYLEPEVEEEFFPTLVYAQPVARREKRRTLEGRSYIDFPVDQTVIYPDYRRNAVELAKIRATIDTVRNDPDATIDTVWLKGFASPESPYSHNTELAIGRTQALKRYIESMYDFSRIALLTDYEPEDWEGLRAAVAASTLEHRDAILAMIDRTDLKPDPKEWLIKSTYPADYKYMLQNFYPALRHTDYRVSYVVREYSDPAEILRIMHEQPRKLDLNEFYVAASTLEPGSDAFTEVFETAVRIYPDDEAANLNAANAALRRDDFAAAERYLAKAGSGADALYARAALAIRRKEYDQARSWLRQALAAGSEQAAVTLDELNKRQK